jgi:hypothetical protein
MHLKLDQKRIILIINKDNCFFNPLEEGRE